MKKVICLGGAMSVWDDLAHIKAIDEISDVIACNDAGLHYGGEIECFCSLETEKIEGWINKRAEVGNPLPKRVWSHRPGKSVDKIVSYAIGKDMTTTGSSGLFAVKCAMELGYDKIVCCGMPMIPQAGHFFDSLFWSQCDLYQIGWVQAYPEIKDKVRSMSGWTAQIFGYPTKGWLNG